MCQYITKTPHQPISLLVFLLFFSWSCSGPSSKEVAEEYLGVPVSEIESELDQLMQLWYPRIVDEENGGYWTNFGPDWTRSEEQTKMLVTQARGLWTAARAARHYPDREVYRKAADAGYAFLTTKMWDAQNSGFYQYYPPPQPPEGMPGHKMSYGNAFALYALSEYAKINPQPEVLDWVRKSFNWLEERAHDPELMGYFNLIFDRPLSPTDTAQQRYGSSLGWGRPDWKDQNSSIHIMEALTTTYEVLPEPLVKDRLQEMLHLVRDTMTHPDGYLRLYFTRDWQPISHRDSSREYILDHLAVDHQSFGHDIETAYLIIDASQVLHGKVDPLTLEKAKLLTDHSLQYGFDENYYGLFDRGYRFLPDREMEIVNNHKVWWAQAEAWHTLALMSAYFPQDSVYPEAFRQMWTYIKQEMIDPEHGGWYNNGLDTDPGNKTRNKAHQWKGAYHNGRALIQVVEYANGRIPVEQ
jgi:mannobiose 2-epimerase